MLLALVAQAAFAAIVASSLWSLVYNAFFSPLARIPGPFLAKFTKLWYLYRVAQGRFEEENIELHRRYGKVVRVAPNMCSIDAPEAVDGIYGIASKMPKSDWYEGWKHPSPDRWTLFPDRDIKRHAATRRRFQSLYSMSSLVTYESYADDCADILYERLAERDGQVVDLANWLQCYAFDVIGSITYSQRFGFLDKGEDVAGILRALHSSMVYSTLIGVFPALHKYVFAVMAWFKMGGAAGRTYLMEFVTARISQRREDRQRSHEHADTKEVDGKDGNKPQDFLDKLMTQSDDDPAKVTPYHIFMMALSNIIAGGDTTAISLTAIFYYAIRTPGCIEKLRQEADEAIPTGGSERHVPFKQANEMPYLQAVIKEALRMHAATGLPLWRVAIEGGVEVDGRYMPPGTQVGLNSWVAHFNEDVFGSDAAEFRPERWLNEKDEGKLKQMNAYYLPVSGIITQLCKVQRAYKLTSCSLGWARGRAWGDTFRTWRWRSSSLSLFKISISSLAAIGPRKTTGS